MVGHGALDAGRDAAVDGGVEGLGQTVGALDDEGARAAAVEVDGPVSAVIDENLGEFGEGDALAVVGLAAVDDDQQAQQLLKDYEAQARRIGELEASGKPIEPEHKQELAQLQSQISSNELIKKFLQAQVGYMDVMRKVNEKINQRMDQ